ncbi:uncharacterized protein LOC127749838 [Frankliniella occidentalis]|uniref:Uncharacterized protein LOC127749838 n=1 Tax=Frankliniella occidentalis TaxID=133901 RepID=A0A9C6WXK5_FRAOC|nr:uncharacterized protein LOC127749838 [Frankliniella occidentalis]
MPTPPTVPTTPTPPTPPTMPAPPPSPPTHRPTTPTPPAPEPWPLPTGVYPGSSSTPATPATAATPTTPATPATSRPPLGLGHVRPMTVSSSSASGALTNTTSTSDVALNPGHSESSLSYSLGTAGTEPGKPALSNSVSVGWSNCRDTGGALGMSYALSYSFLGEGAASAASTVNATCLDMNAVQSQGWSISTSGASAPVGVRSFITEHLASIPGLPRQPTLKYL